MSGNIGNDELGQWKMEMLNANRCMRVDISTTAQVTSNTIDFIKKGDSGISPGFIYKLNSDMFITTSVSNPISAVLHSDALEEIKDDIRLESRLGVGAHGEVWSAKWHGILHQTPVAVKKLLGCGNGDTVSGLSSTRTCVFSEVSIMQSVSHPNVVKLYGYRICHDLSIDLVMELMDCTLVRLIPGLVTWGLKLKALLGIAMGMEYLHSLPVLHRDLKPTNVLANVTRCQETNCIESIEVKVSDFSLSSLMTNTRVNP